MEIITKTEFAKRCGVSNTTVFKWISKDRDGISNYITPDGIKDSIFNVSPWDQMDSRPKVKSRNAILRSDLETEKTRSSGLRSELDETKNKLDEAQGKLYDALDQVKKEKERNEILSKELETVQGDLTNVRAQLADANDRLTKAVFETELIKKDLEKEVAIISEMEKRIAEKDGYIAMFVSERNQKQLTDGSERRTFGQVIRDLFTGKRKEAGSAPEN